MNRDADGMMTSDCILAGRKGECRNLPWYAHLQRHETTMHVTLVVRCTFLQNDGAANNSKGRIECCCEKIICHTRQEGTRQPPCLLVRKWLARFEPLLPVCLACLNDLRVLTRGGGSLSYTSITDRLESRIMGTRTPEDRSWSKDTHRLTLAVPSRHTTKSLTNQPHASASQAKN
jgi:hypothetical protein